MRKAQVGGPDDQPPMAAAFAWVARIFAAVLVMCLPGLGGQWLDRHYGFHVFAIVGFALGLVGGMAYLIAATRAEDSARQDRSDHSDDH